MIYVLVLIFSPFRIAVLPRADLAACIVEAKNRLGEEMEVRIWDNMAGSNPTPKVMAAFCATGSVIDAK